MATSEEEQAKWVKLITLYQQSNYKGSVASWCREHEINYDRFLYWRTKCKTKDQTTLTNSCFKELTTTINGTGVSFECNGIRIHLDKIFDRSTLKECLLTLREIPCSI